MTNSAANTKPTQTRLRCSEVEVIATKIIPGVIITIWLTVTKYPYDNESFKIEKIKNKKFYLKSVYLQTVHT